MEVSISLVEFRRQMPELLARTQLLGQRTRLTRNGKTVAVVVPADDAKSAAGKAKHGI